MVTGPPRWPATTSHGKTCWLRMRYDRRTQPAAEPLKQSQYEWLLTRAPLKKGGSGKPYWISAITLERNSIYRKVCPSLTAACDHRTTSRVQQSARCFRSASRGRTVDQVHEQPVFGHNCWEIGENPGDRRHISNHRWSWCDRTSLVIAGSVELGHLTCFCCINVKYYQHFINILGKKNQ